MTLGVFTSVSIGLEEPGLPAKSKSVVVRVTERLNQFLHFSAGVSTGQGVRGGFEYGYRNLFGQAMRKRSKRCHEGTVAPISRQIKPPLFCRKMTQALPQSCPSNAAEQRHQGFKTSGLRLCRFLAPTQYL